MTQKVSPAEYVIKQFGGVRATARALSTPSKKVWHGTVSKWLSVRRHGTKGLVPARHHKRILELAKEKNLNIKPEHLIIG